MHVQTLSFFINDPVLMPCVAAHLEQALGHLEPATADAVGVGRFDMGDPLVAKVRPPTSGAMLPFLSRLHRQVGIISAVAADGAVVHSYDLQPFRYRNWLFAMAGAIRAFARSIDTQLAIPSYIESNIKGSTVPEVLFHQFLAYLHRQGLLAGERFDMTPLRKALASALSHGSAWFGKQGADNSMVLSDGTVLLGAALERPVYVFNVEGIRDCMACGGDVDGNPVPHPHVRGVAVLDTNALPSEVWQTVGPGRIFQVGRDLQFESFPL